MTTEDEDSEDHPTRKRVRSALQRPRVPLDCRDPYVDDSAPSGDALERAVLTLCNEEFERAFGEPFYGTERKHSSASEMFIRFVEADQANKRDEDKARALYETFRAKMDRSLEPWREFRQSLPDGAGGAAAFMLGALESFFATKVLPVSGLPHSDLSRRDGRAAFVATFGGDPKFFYPKVKVQATKLDGTIVDVDQARALTNRELAVIGILVGVGGPSAWIATRGEHLLTANDAIRDEEKRMGAIRAAQEKDRRGE